jgi:predicted MFS family arabinose efflux permease
MPQKENNPATPRYAWIILAVVYLATFAGNSMLNKVSPLVLTLTDEFGVSLSQVGLLMSMFGLTGLILAIPAGIILQRRGLRITGTVALGFVASGAVLGAMSNSFSLLLFSRLVEGVGVALIVVVSPAAIAMWFPPQKSGAPMGIWSTSTPLSGFIIISFAPLLALSIGWSGIWRLTAGVAIIALIVYWLFMRPPPYSQGAGGISVSAAPPSEAFSLLKKTRKNDDIWLLGLALLIFNLLVIPLITYYPAFLSSILGFPMTRAGLVVGIMGLATIPSAPLSGLISDVIGSRKWVAVAGFALLAPLYALAFHVSGGMVFVVAILLGFFVITVPVSIFASVPDVMSDVKMVGIGMAILVLGQSFGMIIGPLIFGSLVPLCILGIVVILLNKKMP